MKRKLKKRYRVVNRRRFGFSIMTLVIFTSICFTIAVRSLAAEINIQEKCKIICVTKGDTIWGIANDNLPKGKDTRRFINDIIELNNLNNSTIYEGQSLKVPVK